MENNIETAAEFYKNCEYIGFAKIMVEYANQFIDWKSVTDELPDTDRLVQVRNDGCNPRYSHAIYKEGKWMNPYYKNQKTKPEPEYWREI